MATEGLYRVSGNTVETGKLTRLLEVGTSVSVDTLDLLDKHVIACAIKKVLAAMIQYSRSMDDYVEV